MNELDIYQSQGFGNSSGFGARPALLVIDFVNGFNDEEQFGGGNIRAAIEKTKTLLAGCRASKIPVAFTRVVYAADGSDAGVFTLKVPSLTSLTESSDGAQIVPQLTPLAGEYVLTKTQPSAFFGTDFTGWLTLNGIDTVLVTGCTTSGCVRASVIDAMSHNYRTIVVTDCVGDRALAPHEANLFDMGQKYADLMTCADVIAKLNRISSAA